MHFALWHLIFLYYLQHVNNNRTVSTFCYENTLYLYMHKDIIGSGSQCPEMLNAGIGSIKCRGRNKDHMTKTERYFWERRNCVTLFVFMD